MLFSLNPIMKTILSILTTALAVMSAASCSFDPAKDTVAFLDVE